MSKPELEQPPAYVRCSPEEWAVAKAEYAAKRMTPHFTMGAGFRRSSLKAAITCGLPIKPVIAVEFRDLLDAQSYKPTPPPDAAAHQAKVAKERAAADAFAEKVAAERAKPQRFASTQHAYAVLGPHAFNAWAESPEGQQFAREENAGVSLAKGNLI